MIIGPVHAFLGLVVHGIAFGGDVFLVVLAEACSSSARRSAALGPAWSLERWLRSFASACCVEVWCRPGWSSTRVERSLGAGVWCCVVSVFGGFGGGVFVFGQVGRGPGAGVVVGAVAPVFRLRLLR